MKIIDFSRKGNQVRFYLGDDKDKKYHGDDWDDVPYEHNAGSVYEEFVKGHIDIVFPFDWSVLEPCNGESNSLFCKDDFKKRLTPCIIAFEPDEDDWLSNSYKKQIGREDIIKFFFGDSLDSIIAKSEAIKAKFDENTIFIT